MSDIEKADEIVGITEILGPGGALDYADRATKDTYRRGAYVGWLPKQDGFLGSSGPLASGPLEAIASEIVRLHKPKGDGLPSHVSFAVLAEGFGDVTSPLKTSFEFCEAMSERERDALATYFRRCLAPPVRRLLAAFEVVEPGGELIHGSYIIEKPNTKTARERLCPPEICRLVPRAAR